VWMYIFWIMRKSKPSYLHSNFTDIFHRNSLLPPINLNTFQVHTTRQFQGKDKQIFRKKNGFMMGKKRTKKTFFFRLSWFHNLHFVHVKLCNFSFSYPPHLPTEYEIKWLALKNKPVMTKLGMIMNMLCDFI